MAPIDVGDPDRDTSRTTAAGRRAQGQSQATARTTTRITTPTSGRRRAGMPVADSSDDSIIQIR